jgi:hypothetical protein
MQQLDNNNGRAVFSKWSVPRYSKQWRKSVDNSVREFVKRGPEPEAEIEPLLEPLPGNV